MLTISHSRRWKLDLNHEHKLKYMKKRRKILIGFFLPLVLIGGYLFGAFFLIKDEYSEYLRKVAPILVSEKKGEEIVLEIDINNFDEPKCKFSYCVVNSCGNYLTLPCDKLLENRYEGEGRYQLTMYFDSYVYNPFSHKFLKSWDISKINNNKLELTKEEYIEGIKSVLGEYPISQGYSCTLLNKTFNPNQWVCDNESFFSNEYLKTISLLHDLGEKLGDEELLSYAQAEIEYLNNNFENILKEGIVYPEAYILKLVEIGLSTEYITLIEDFEIPIYEVEKIEDHDYKPLLSKEEELYPRFYTSILRYSDYSRVFKEFGKEDLSKYYSNELVLAYNRSPFVLYGLCTVGRTTQDTEIFEYVSTKLSKSITEKDDPLILNNLTELLSCNLYAKEMNSVVVGLDEEIQELTNNSTLEIDGKAYIVYSRLIDMVGAEGEEEFQQLVFNYRMIDNLIYVLYE